MVNAVVTLLYPGWIQTKVEEVADVVKDEERNGFVYLKDSNGKTKKFYNQNVVMSIEYVEEDSGAEER